MRCLGGCLGDGGDMGCFPGGSTCGFGMMSICYGCVFVCVCVYDWHCIG